jgi:hypothetical protein
MSFAETANLHIRGYRAADLDRVTALLADVHTQRGDPGYVVPGSEPKGKKTVEDFVPKLLMFCVLEAKAPLEDGSDWVGICTFANKGSPKNRNAMFGICLEEKFWGRGYGTQRHGVLGALRVLISLPFDQPRRRSAGCLSMPSTSSACTAYRSASMRTTLAPSRCTRNGPCIFH